MKKKFLITIPIILFLCLLGGAFYLHSMFGKIKRKELPRGDAAIGITVPVQPYKKTNTSKVINIALFGLDARDPNYASRSDSIMVLSIDEENQKLKVSSLMRDLYVPIPGKIDNRLNVAYAFGGPVLALKTINTDFQLDIRNYVTVNFFGLEKLIDKIGGVEINVKPNEVPYVNGGVEDVSEIEGDKHPAFISKSGPQILNGRQTVAYSRIRHTGDSDYERTQRQRIVLNNIFQKIKSQGITKLPGIINTMLPFVETSMSNKDIISLASEVYKYKVDGIEQFRIPVEGLFKSQVIRGMDVLVPDIQANNKRLHEFIYGEQNNAATP